MMKQPKISVALSTYNRADMLPRMLGCILGQDFTDYELLLINNGSVDDTDKVCRQYEKQDNRIRLFTLPENLGPAGAKNYALQKAAADYICFVDDDDYCEKNYLSLLYSSITQYNADIAVTGCVDEYETKIVPKFDYDEVYIWNKVEAVSEFLKREKFNAAPPTKIFRKSLFDKIAFIPCIGPDDIHVVYKLFVEAEKVVVRGNPTYRFHKHADNVTAFITENKITSAILDQYLKMQKERVRYISDKIPGLAPQVRYASYSYMISMVEKIKIGHGEGCDSQCVDMIEKLRDNQMEFLSSGWVTEREKRLMREYVINKEY
ncbi:MAG: glycosyl transferase [Clostridia bacterium]|nr:glycosyl transferase [Clostridia bacterium]